MDIIIPECRATLYIPRLPPAASLTPYCSTLGQQGGKLLVHYIDTRVILCFILFMQNTEVGWPMTACRDTLFMFSFQTQSFTHNSTPNSKLQKKSCDLFLFPLCSQCPALQILSLRNLVILCVNHQTTQTPHLRPRGV